MRILLILLPLVALAGCATMPSDTDERALAFAELCVNNSDLDDLRDHQNRPGMCGLEHGTLDGNQRARTVLTRDGRSVQIAYINGRKIIDTCTATRGRTYACGAELRNIPVPVSSTIGDVAAQRQARRTMLVCDSVVQAFDAIRFTELSSIQRNSVVNGCEREPEPTGALAQYLDRVEFTPDGYPVGVIEYSFPSLGSKGRFYALDTKPPRRLVRASMRRIRRR